jgi:hypothetical protein
MQPKVTGFTEESNVVAFKTLEIFQVRKKEKEAQEEENNNHQISCRGKIWTIELHVQTTKENTHEIRSGSSDLA